jgi:dihydropteroate synthase
MFPEKPRYINTGGKLVDLEIPKVMGILNITPDSFYQGSRFCTDKEILTAAAGMLEDGADILDIGGYSSRPGAKDISPEEEGNRVLKAVKLIAGEFPEAIISIDTFRADIAEEAVAGCGAHMINDISGGEADSKMFLTVEKLKVPYILMHMKGNPRTMADETAYEDIITDILKWFGERIFKLRSVGLKDIIIDPGFGFSKTIDQNFEILSRLGDFSITGLPLMVGLSRKSMIWKTLKTDIDEALNGTTVLNTIALFNGADILRVHDVKEAVQTVRLIDKIKQRSEIRKQKTENRKQKTENREQRTGRQFPDP